MKVGINRCFEALGLVGALLKVDPILATCHTDALTSLLWAVRPPESLWEQLEDPALLLTFGVHEAPPKNQGVLLEQKLPSSSTQHDCANG